MKLLSIKSYQHLEITENLKVGDKIRLYEAIKFFHRNDFWENQSSFDLFYQQLEDEVYSNFTSTKIIATDQDEAEKKHDESIKTLFKCLTEIRERIQLIRTTFEHLNNFYPIMGNIKNENEKSIFPNDHFWPDYQILRKNLLTTMIDLKIMANKCNKLVDYAETFFPDVYGNYLGTEVEEIGGDLGLLDLGRQVSGSGAVFEKFGYGLRVFGIGVSVGILAGHFY